MAFKHGRDTYLSLNGSDLSAYCNTSELEVGSDEHDVTTYGKDDHVFAGGLLNGKATMGGIYDDGVAGPKAVIEPLIGTVVTLIRRPLGTGSGLKQESLSVLVKSYKETNPVADMIAWTCEMTKSDAITRTTQA
jgi:hypothetical protein